MFTNNQFINKNKNFIMYLLFLLGCSLKSTKKGQKHLMELECT